MVERLLAKQKIAGSIPVSRSLNKLYLYLLLTPHHFLWFLFAQNYPLKSGGGLTNLYRQTNIIEFLKRGSKMNFSLKSSKFRSKNIFIIAVIAGVLIWSSAIIFGLEIKRVEGDSFLSLSPVLSQNKEVLSQNKELVTIQENSLLPISNPAYPTKPVQKIKMVITAYSSTPLETDNTPFITAAGTWTREGIVANNLLPYGTEVRIPEIYGDKIFVVEDRMHWRKGYYHLDIWFPERWQALNFGTKRAYVEVLES